MCDVFFRLRRGRRGRLSFKCKREVLPGEGGVRF